MCWDAVSTDVSYTLFGNTVKRANGIRALQIGLAVILQSSANFEVNGPLEYAGMPEMGITSCPLLIIPKDDVGI